MKKNCIVTFENDVKVLVKAENEEQVKQILKSKGYKSENYQLFWEY